MSLARQQACFISIFANQENYSSYLENENIFYKRKICHLRLDELLMAMLFKCESQ